VYVMDIPDTFNSILYATLAPTESSNLQANFGRFLNNQSADLLLLQSMMITLSNIQPAPQQTTVFTDDLNPIEWLTNNLILNFLLTGGAETMQ
jgi:hypothetical protein